MYRVVLEKLNKWKEKSDRLPLILLGARQVGKTWLLKEFGKKFFNDVCYINFEQPNDLAQLFDGSINVERILDYLSTIHGKKIEKQKTLIIFDEVQEVPRALTSLKYFAENASDYAICCAGSLLGITLHEGTSFPVGKVEFMTLQPFSFYEFLLAHKEEQTIEYIKKYYKDGLPSTIAEKMNDYLKQYYIVGGMPKCVDTWIKTHDYQKVSNIQKDIIASYQNDFSKHAPKRIVPKIHHVWESIPSQLAKENKKFIYGVVREGARAREYEDALMWLKDCSAVRRVGLVAGGRLPLKAYEDLKCFKIYHLDIGLLRTMCDIDPSIIVSKEKLFMEFNGALTEQFVLQELQSLDIFNNIYYWTECSMAEVDFLFSYKNKVVPCEAKAGLNVHAKSLKVFMEKYKPEMAIRTSLKDYREDGCLLNLPLYEIWLLPEIMS